MNVLVALYSLENTI